MNDFPLIKERINLRLRPHNNRVFNNTEHPSEV